MKKIIDFLSLLQENNNRPWFNDHKREYKEVEARFHDFVARLIRGIASFDASVANLTVQDCTYRIYRDTRFSHDKTPYKTHMGAYICMGGKKSGNAGYYFHIEPANSNSSATHLLSSGLYMPEKNFLHSVREDILYRGDEFLSAVKKATGFTLNMEESLKRVPRDFPTDSPYTEYLKLKNIYLEKLFDDDFLLDPSLLENTVHSFQKTHDLTRFLNRAICYAREEEPDNINH